MEHATRRILHVNVTAHPTAPWTLQQLREAIPCDHPYRFLLHDRDSIFSEQLDQSMRNLVHDHAAFSEIAKCFSSVHP